MIVSPLQMFHNQTSLIVISIAMTDHAGCWIGLTVQALTQLMMVHNGGISLEPKPMAQPVLIQVLVMGDREMKFKIAIVKYLIYHLGLRKLNSHNALVIYCRIQQEKLDTDRGKQFCIRDGGFTMDNYLSSDKYIQMGRNLESSKRNVPWQFCVMTDTNTLGSCLTQQVTHPTMQINLQGFPFYIPYVRFSDQIPVKGFFWLRVKF